MESDCKMQMNNNVLKLLLASPLVNMYFEHIYITVYFVGVVLKIKYI